MSGLRAGRALEAQAAASGPVAHPTQEAGLPGGCADRHLPPTWQDPSRRWLSSGVEPARLCGASALNLSYDNQLQERVPRGPLVTNAAFTERSL